MLEDLSEKFGKIKITDGSLIKKLEKIKKGTDASYRAGSPPLIPDIIEQLRKATKEISGSVENSIKAKSDQIKSNTESIKIIESKITNLEQMVSSGKNEKDEFKERLDKIDGTILELLSLYEVVQSTVNPFVGDNDNFVNKKITDIEKKVNEFVEKRPEIPQDLLDGFQNKVKSLENNIEELKSRIGPNGLEENALAENTIKPNIPESVQAPIVQQADISQSINEEKNRAKLNVLDNRPETSIILLNWIEFLLEKVGRNNLFDVLEYYIDIGWISEEISSKMMVYASGIDYYVERPTWKLLPEDHTKSLLFIEQLRGKKLDRNLFSRLERDVDKIIRSEEVIKL